MQKRLLASFLALAILVAWLVPSPAFAHDPFYGGFGGYYGRGGHDVFPHWHRSVTPFGSYYWYGRGAHDYRPHHHVITPYSYRGYSYGPWGYTESIYPRYPYYYAPW